MALSHQGQGLAGAANCLCLWQSGSGASRASVGLVRGGWLGETTRGGRAGAGLVRLELRWYRGLPKLPWVSVWVKPTRGGACVPTAHAEEL